MKAENRDVDVAQNDATPSVETTMRFLALYDRYGSHEAVVARVARGRRAGVPGCPGATTGRRATRSRCAR